MCGLVGWTGNDPKKFNYSKLHTLGVLNETRGKHSCGVSFDGEIWAGVDKEKLFRDFSPTVNALLEDYPLENAVVIGHTRWATGGAHNKDNAHPFGFGNTNNGSFEFIGAHNGSLLDYEDLAKTYGIEVNIGKKKNKRKKIDSEVLLEIIYLYGPDVLTEYLGAAALLWYDIHEDNVMYAYHGQSKTYKNSHTVSEERPLFYLKDQEGSLYVSSIKESLECINSTGGEIDKFEYNKLYKITDGDIDNAEILEIDRSKCHQKEFYNNYRGNTCGYNYHNYGQGATYPNYNAVEETEEVDTITPTNLTGEKIKGKFNDLKTNVHFKRLRYWHGDKLISGVYAPLKSSSMHFLGHNTKEALKNYNKLGANLKYSKDPILFYYFRGIALETELDYNIAIGRSNKMTLLDLSHMSKYPIVDLANKNGKIIKNTKWADDFILPYLSTKVYTIAGGQCVHQEEHKNNFNEYKDALLDSDKEVLKTVLGDDTFDMSSDEEELTLIKEELEGSIDECITDINEKIEDNQLKADALGVFQTIKEKVKSTFELLWQTEKLD